MFREFKFLGNLADEWLTLLNSAPRSIVSTAKSQKRRIEWAIRKRLQEEVTISIKQGSFTCLTSDKEIARRIFLEGEFGYAFSLRCFDFMKKHGYIPATGAVTCFNIGANIGTLAIGLVKAGRIDGIIAFEPEPRNFDLLQRNVKKNSFDDRICCVQLALSNTAEPLTMELSDVNPGDHRIRKQGSKVDARFGEDKRKTVDVQAKTLDDFNPAEYGCSDTRFSCNDAPSLIWLDVEGHEGYIFEGGRKTFQRDIPTVAEVWPYGILRSGMSLAQFTKIVQNLWQFFWVERASGFVCYPTSVFTYFLDELGTTGRHEDIVLTKSRGSNN
jgi:FkbM family methyltransferase